jgi:5,6-dimethylbenzimidazole synthase
MQEGISMRPPEFSDDFRRQFRELLAWRRDVRRFRRQPIDPAILGELLSLARLAPSVGNSQPWRFVLVEEPVRRAEIRDVFARCNEAARATYSDARAALYGQLKLAGMEAAPCQLAVFADEATSAGHGLGRHTMPETLHDSVVAAVHTLWLAARAYGLGVGWVSILEPREVMRVLDVPNDWSLVAYLCVGYPEEEHMDPELERHNWQERLADDRVVVHR